MIEVWVVHDPYHLSLTVFERMGDAMDWAFRPGRGDGRSTLGPIRVDPSRSSDVVYAERSEDGEVVGRVEVERCPIQVLQYRVPGADPDLGLARDKREDDDL